MQLFHLGKILRKHKRLRIAELQSEVARADGPRNFYAWETFENLFYICYNEFNLKEIDTLYVSNGHMF